MATTTATTSLQERAKALLDSLGSSGILLVEWETTLWIRLGYPLAWDGSLFLLVPDDQLPQVRSLAADIGLFPANESTLKSAYACEQDPLALRFLVEEQTSPEQWCLRRRLVFAPFSWAGLRPSDAVPITSATTKVHHNSIALQHHIVTLPPFVKTVPLSVACAALVRIMARSSYGSSLRINTIESLGSVIGYALIDMSYEGDYMEIVGNEVPLSDAEKKEIEDAVGVMEGWAMREGEEWIRSDLIAIMRGEKRYNDLPGQETKATRLR
ncbi:hypothetical protein QBC39DRAFT_252546 [Podospora conica]|nr:hypothetical protein QBC39DRAFT_252546 [Schizothecium conicum]